MKVRQEIRTECKDMSKLLAFTYSKYVYIHIYQQCFNGVSKSLTNTSKSVFSYFLYFRSLNQGTNKKNMIHNKVYAFCTTQRKLNVFISKTELNIPKPVTPC